jgi:HEPN domain-containing protein
MLRATENWLAQVEYDLGTAEQMFAAGRHIYVIFMCHLALEKALKALVTEETGKLPPKIHDLIDLAQRARLLPSQDQREFIARLNDASVVTRYPDDLSQMMLQYPESLAREYLEKTKELVRWIRQDRRLSTS